MKTNDKKLLIKRLQRWGYLEYELNWKEFDREGIASALAEYQEFHDVPLHEACRRLHGRSLNTDGVIGPATLELMNARTCDVPDPVYMRGGPLEANWPQPCRDHITVSWNFGSAPGLSKEDTTKVWQETAAEYTKRFKLKLDLSPADFPNTRIWARLKALPGSTLAWSYLANNSCQSHLEQAYDNTIQWSWNLALGTWKHEVGHALGMHHTPNDPKSLMYPSMNGQTGMNQTDIDQMIRIGYKLRGDDGGGGGNGGDPEKPVKVLVVVGGKTYKHTWSTAEGINGPDLTPL